MFRFSRSRFNYHLFKYRKAKRDGERNYGSAYEGEGKTSGKIINKGEAHAISVEGISTVGFRLSSGMKILGPTIMFPHAVMSWKVKSAADVNEDSLVLFSVMQPKIDVLIFGYGNKSVFTKELESNFFKTCKKLKINFEALPTEDACTTFNFLSLECRFVAGAFIPPHEIVIYRPDDLITEDAQKIPNA